MSNPYAITSVTVDSWGLKTNGNDCYWNIAKNQIEQSGGTATTEKIAELTNEIQQYNVDKNDNVQTKDATIYEGEQIFIPLEYAMDEIDDKIKTATDSATEWQGKLESAETSLSETEAATGSALETMKSLQTEYENAVKDSRPDADGVKGKLEFAKKDYENALKAEKEAKDNVEEYKKKLEESNEELKGLRDDLNEIKEEYSDEETKQSGILSELDDKISALNGQISDTENELEQAQNALDQAKADETAAESLGYNADENGNYSQKDESKMTSGNIQNAINTSNPVKTYNTGMEDGRRTKTIIYMDGTQKKYIEKDGTWQLVKTKGNNNSGQSGQAQNQAGTETTTQASTEAPTQAATEAPTQAPTEAATQVKEGEEVTAERGQEIIEDIDDITSEDTPDDQKPGKMQKLVQKYGNEDTAKATVEKAFEGKDKNYKINGHTKDEYLNVIKEAYNPSKR